jgi:S-adenosylmethionine decarboxylase proenzyme
MNWYGFSFRARTVGVTVSLDALFSGYTFDRATFCPWCWLWNINLTVVQFTPGGGTRAKIVLKNSRVLKKYSRARKSDDCTCPQAFAIKFSPELPRVYLYASTTRAATYNKAMQLFTIVEYMIEKGTGTIPRVDWHSESVAQPIHRLKQEIEQRRYQVSDHMKERNNNTNGASREDRRYAIDVRVFFAFITLVMAASFIAGVVLVPEETVIRTVSQQAPVPPPSVADAFLRNISDQESKLIEEQHSPSGQHLLVDIRYVDAEFLNSEERLSKAMVDTVKEAGLTMLSYHCHAIMPAGISCVGVLMGSHISFHTWPAEGVITLDLFTCGNNPLLPVVETIEKLFGIPDGSENPIRVQVSSRACELYCH